MSKINLTPNASGTGVFTIASPNSNTDYTLTLPEVTGGDFIVSDASGNVTIGGTTPGNAGTVNVSVGSPGSTIGGLQLWSTTSGSHFMQFGDAASGNGYYRGAIGYLHASDALVAYSAGAERMRIDASGNVGIGTASPSSALHVDSSNDGPIFDSGGTGNTNHALLVRDSANTQLFRVNNDGNVGIGTTSPGAQLDITNATEARLRLNHTVSNTWDLANDSNLKFSRGGSEKMRIDAGGNVGIGSTSPTSGRALTLNNASNYYGIEFQVGGTSYGRIIQESTGNMYYDANTNIVFRTNTTTERMRIDSSGNLLVGRTNGITFGANSNDGVVLQPNRLDVSAASVARITQIRDSSGTLDRFYNGASIVGSITCTTSATSYNPSSDARLKENIRDYDNALADVMKLKPRKYSWKVDGAEDNGFIAQELLETPEFANRVNPLEDGDDPIYGVDYMKFVAVLTGAIQEQQVMIEELKAEVAALKGA